VVGSTSARQATCSPRSSIPISSGTCRPFGAGPSNRPIRDGARAFLADWVEAWEDWELEIEELLDAGDKVVAIMHQHGRAKATGLPVDMDLAQVWTIRDGKEVRMEMYANPEEALEAAGLAE
jgi:ketosteroid isomerase-like protein